MAGNINLLRTFSASTEKVSSNFEKLSSGKRINRAKDDAAGLQIAAQLQTDTVTLTKGAQNIDYSQASLEIAGGALSQIADIAGRLGELATQAANGALSDAQRESLNGEYQQLTQEVGRIASTTQFNGKSLLDGSQLNTQVGTDGSSKSTITVEGVDLSSLASAISGQDISTAEGAQNAISLVNSFATSVGDSQGTLGAGSSRLSTAQSNNVVAAENSTAARSRIEDVDYAAELADKTANQIRQQVGAALNAQAGGLQRDTVLKLLQ